MKVSIIGGGGRVGSSAAFALQCGGVVSEIRLIDANEQVADGEALDLLHGSAFTADQQIYFGDYSRASNSDIFIITAGLRRKPDESRLDLINRNVSLFLQILSQMKSAGIRDDAIIFVVTNPVDILTQITVEFSGLPWQQVIGLGTMLDTARFCSLIANELKTAPTQVRALMLGEHGDSMVPIWSSATINGLPLTSVPELTTGLQQSIVERVRQSGAEMIRKKGGAGWAVAVSVREVVHSIALNRRQILPVCSYQIGAYDLNDICISVPTVIGSGGIHRHIVFNLWPKELTALQNSGRLLKQTRASVKTK